MREKRDGRLDENVVLSKVLVNEKDYFPHLFYISMFLHYNDRAASFFSSYRYIHTFIIYHRSFAKENLARKCEQPSRKNPFLFLLPLLLFLFFFNYYFFLLHLFFPLPRETANEAFVNQTFILFFSSSSSSSFCLLLLSLFLGQLDRICNESVLKDDY